MSKIFISCLIFLSINIWGTTTETKNEYAEVFKKAGYEGCFVMLDLNSNHKIVYNSKRCKERFSPASTSKIANSLIALECKVAKDENHTIKWDGKKRFYSVWNKDHNMAEALKNSTVWYYQELARQIGQTRMDQYIRKIDYGNNNTSGRIDMFWLNDSLKISANEQIDFLKKLYSEDMNFSAKSFAAVKKIMIRKQTDKYTLRSKTGASDQGSVRWYVGYIEQNSNVYFFAVNIKMKDKLDSKFMKARIEIAEEILKLNGLM